MGVNIWSELTVGIGGEFIIPKRKLWFELVPGLAFKAVWFGRKRKKLFHETEYLVLYRFDIYKESQCQIAWIPVSQLIAREMNKIIDKDYNS